MPALQREAAEERSLGDLRQFVPRTGRIHVHTVELKNDYSMSNMTGRPGYRTMEMNGGSSTPYPACTPCVPLFVHCIIRVEAEGLLDYHGRAGIISIVLWNLRPVIFGVELRIRFYIICEIFAVIALQDWVGWGIFTVIPGYPRRAIRRTVTAST